MTFQIVCVSWLLGFQSMFLTIPLLLVWDIVWDWMWSYLMASPPSELQTWPAWLYVNIDLSGCRPMTNMPICLTSMLSLFRSLLQTTAHYGPTGQNSNEALTLDFSLSWDPSLFHYTISGVPEHRKLGTNKEGYFYSLMKYVVIGFDWHYFRIYGVCFLLIGSDRCDFYWVCLVSLSAISLWSLME